MSTTQNDTALETLLARLSNLEQELATLRAGHPVSGSLTTNHSPRGVLERHEEPGEAPTPSKRRSRRGLLRTALVSGAAVVGAGALLGRSTGVAHADGNETPTAFTSDNSQFHYAVSASGTNGAVGGSATSDSNVGVDGFSISGTAVLGFSFKQYGVHAIGGGAIESASVSFCPPRPSKWMRCSAVPTRDCSPPPSLSISSGTSTA